MRAENLLHLLFMFPEDDSVIQTEFCLSTPITLVEVISISYVELVPGTEF